MFNGYDNESDFDRLFIVSEEIFAEFESNVIDSSEELSSPESRVYEHMHSRCIFDSFNETLNSLRRGYRSNGEPFPWEINNSQLELVRATDSGKLKEILDKVRGRRVIT